jgi:hypothetical protein
MNQGGSAFRLSMQARVLLFKIALPIIPINQIKKGGMKTPPFS